MDPATPSPSFGITKTDICFFINPNLFIVLLVDRFKKYVLIIFILNILGCYHSKYIQHSMIYTNCISLTETYYWFGDNNFTEWKSLFDLYKPPPYELPKMTGVYSFGLAG